MKTFVCIEQFNVDMVEYEGSDVVIGNMLVREGSIWEMTTYHNSSMMYNRETDDWLDLDNEDRQKYFKEVRK